MNAIPGQPQTILRQSKCQEQKDEEEDEPDQGQKDHLEEPPLHEWSFTLSTVVSSPASAACPAASDTLGVVDVDPTDRILATAGIARKIRIYNLDRLVRDEDDSCTTTPSLQENRSMLDHASACSHYICTPAKLSSLRWRPDCGGRIAGCGDYDGVVTEYDLERRVAVLERDEHGGRRVWSVDYSNQHLSLAASGSDDGTAQLWDYRSGSSAAVATIRQGSSVCCVEFDPTGGPMLAVGAADCRACLYDVRNVSTPAVTFSGHRRTVTFVRFLPGGEAMVSAGTDGCLRTWVVADGRPERTFRGHENRRSFVGLAVWRGGGLMSCGSESNEVVVYDRRWGRPVWANRFGSPGQAAGGGGFVSSVCWRQQSSDEGRCTLVAGGSDGMLGVFAGRKLTSP